MSTMNLESLSDRIERKDISEAINNLIELMGEKYKILFNPSNLMQDFLTNISKKDLKYLIEGGKINIDIVENNTLKKRISFVSLEDIRDEKLNGIQLSYDEIDIYPVDE